MKKKLSPAKPPLPKFQSDQEAAEYFENHSVASAWDQLPEAPQAKPLPALARQIRDRHARAKSPISLRLAPEQIAAAKHIAAAICSGAERSEIGDFARAWRSRICLASAGRGFACGASGNWSHALATEWLSKYSAASWSD